ncbi:MAG: hypothetical protein QW221_08145, partial [Candidatus Korarchaeum sp.]
MSDYEAGKRTFNSLFGIPRDANLYVVVISGFTFNSLFGILRTMRSRTTLLAISFNSLFGIQSVESVGSGLFLPVTFNSLFGILHEEYINGKRRRKLSTPFSGFGVKRTQRHSL